MDWDFTLANYDAVWAFIVQLGLLILFMMLGNILRHIIPLFRKCLIPSALLGGGLLLAVNIIGKQFGFVLVDNRLMQVITYHCLAIGFASMSLKTEKSAHKTSRAQVVEFGALQGGTYMLQAFAGLGITLILFLLTNYSDNVISYVCGLILPLAYGQGPGNALSWDINFTNNAATQFAGNGSFGLSLASIGFVALAYAISFGFMVFWGKLSAFTNSIAWGFNFLWASLAAILIRFMVQQLRKRKLLQREYINNYQIKECFKGFEHEFFLMSFGTMTGTASNGMILMKEIDPVCAHLLQACTYSPISRRC